MTEIINMAEWMPPENETLAELRRRVESRIQEEAADDGDENKPGGGTGGDGIDQSFVMDCLKKNELGDGLLFSRLHDGQFTYNKAMGRWMVWRGHYWEVDQMDLAMVAVEDVVAKYKEAMAALYEEAKKDDGAGAKDMQKQVKLIMDRVSALRSVKRRGNCLTMAHTCDGGLSVRGDEFDQRPWLLACKNCVIDLKTGASRPGRQHDYLIKHALVDYQGIDTPCPTWVKFLNILFQEDHLYPDEEHPVTDFMQRLLGYAILGTDKLHIFPIFLGEGRNGKGTIVKILCSLMGELADTMRPEMLLDNGRMANASGPTPQIIALRGLRMAFASETNEGCKLSLAEVKRLTGGDKLKGRTPHDKFEVSFDPTHTLFLLTNALPHASAEDFAFWERAFVVDFPLSFVNREPERENERRADIDLYDKLMAEAPGILAWLVEGCIKWQKFGLNPPAKVLINVQEYRKDEDNFGAFIDHCCLIDDAAQVGASQLYDLFSKWWVKFVNKYPMKQKKFGMLMRKRFRAEKVGGLYRYYGIGVMDHIYADYADQQDDGPEQ